MTVTFRGQKILHGYPFNYNKTYITYEFNRQHSFVDEQIRIDRSWFDIIPSATPLINAMVPKLKTVEFRTYDVGSKHRRFLMILLYYST